LKLFFILGVLVYILVINGGDEMINYNTKSYVLIAIFAGALGTKTNASLITYEGFDTASLGALNGQAGASSTGWSLGSSWTTLGSSDVVASGLQSPTTLNTVSAQSLQKVAGQQLYAIRPYGLTTLTTGQSIYFSFLEQGMGGSNTFVDLAFQGQGFASVLHGNGTIQAAGPVLGTIGVLPTSSTNPLLIIGEIQVNDATTRNYTLKLSTPSNPDISGSPLTLLSTASGVNVNVINNAINGITIFSQANDPVFTIDEIRIGTAIEDVYATAAPVPEPATIGVLALGALGALRKRRR
jgi:hypothetical protein